MELQILDNIQTYLRSDLGDVLFPKISALGNAGILWVILAFILVIIPKTRKVGVSMWIGLILELIVCDITLKPLVGRIRPFDVNTSVELLINAPKDYSFPSGHSGAAFVAVSSLYFNKNKLWIPVFILSITIAFSRLYLYVHYPSDVISGIFIGTILGYIGARLAAFIYKKIDSAKNNKVAAK